MKLSDRYLDPDAPMEEPMRYLHEGCSEGKDSCLVVKKIRHPKLGYGWVYLCHRCGLSGFQPMQMTMKDWIKHQEQEAIEEPRGPQEHLELPPDWTKTIPPKGLTWLYRYGIEDEEIINYGICYSPSMGRLILPVYDDGELVYYQGRYLGDDEEKYRKRKYLNVRLKRDKATYFVVEDPCRDPGWVLVEDILSAIKVGRVMDCIGLLGSYLSDELMFRLKGETVFIWLDPDKLKQALKYSYRWMQFGVDAHPVLSRLDPKEYTTKEIAEYLGCQIKR